MVGVDIEAYISKHNARSTDWSKYRGILESAIRLNQFRNENNCQGTDINLGELCQAKKTKFLMLEQTLGTKEIRVGPIHQSDDKSVHDFFVLSCNIPSL